MNLALELKNDNGNLKVDYSDARMRTRDYTVDLAGSSDISRAVEKMLKDFKVFFESELTRMLASRYAKLTEKMLNEKLLL